MVFSVGSRHHYGRHEPREGSMSALESWREEMQSAWLYRRIATAERDPVRSRLFVQLAEAAERQAQVWHRLLGQGAPAPAFHPTRRARLVVLLLRVIPPRRLRPVLAAMKVRGLSAYDHALPGHAMPTRLDQVGARHRGAGSGGNLRAAVFGVNDGLVSNTSLIMGVAGASVEPGLILTTGIAGLLAGALSMAAGEYVSMRSQRELYEYQIGLEREELEQYPEEEAEELALVYQARGMPLDEARAVARKLLQHPEHALDTLAREELGLNPDDLGSPWGAAIFSFLSFTAGAVIPLAPFALRLESPVLITAGLAGAALFAVGSLLSLFTGRGALRGGLRMLAIGGTSALATYLIGTLLGVSLS
jgi:vacuolar iron transporter family protein